MLKISIFMLLMLLMSACGQKGGKAVGAGGVGPSPFPIVKANCGDSSCL